MYVDHSHREDPRTNSLVWIYDIYRLRADETYRVSHPALSKGRKVLIYTDKGQGKIVCGEKEHLLENNTAFVFDGETPFCYWTEGKEWHFWWYEFCGEDPCRHRFVYSVSENEEIRILCARTMEALRTGEPDSSALAAAYFSALLAFVSETASGEADIVKGLFERIQSFMKEKLYHTNVSFAAQHFGVDPRTMYNLFRRYSEYSPKEYLKNCVMERAKYLLKNTTKSIGEIADETGFSNSFHFSRVFREEAGVSPSQYRQQTGQRSAGKK